MMRTQIRRLAQRSSSRSSPAFPISAEGFTAKASGPSAIAGYLMAGTMITGVFAFYGGMSSFSRAMPRVYDGDKAEQKRWGPVGLYTEKHLYEVNPSQKL